MPSFQISRCRARIIRSPSRGLALWLAAVCALAFTGCSSIRLAYDNAPRLTWWWMDGYADFASEQTPPVKQAIDDYYAWHRQTQLPPYAALLAEMQAPLLLPTTAAAVCQWQERVQTVLRPALERALQTTADRLPALSETEFANISKRYDKRNAEFRKDYLQPDPATRAEAAFDRAEERFERIYGRLEAPQKAVIRNHVARSAYDLAPMFAERQRRQSDTIETLRRLQSDGSGPGRRLNALRGLAERFESSPDPGYRQTQRTLRLNNCEFAAQFHNATTPAQKAKARDTAKGYEADLRALVSAVE